MINGRDTEELTLTVGLALDVQREPGRVRVVASGELDLSTSPDLEQELDAIIDRGGCRELVLDLSDVAFLDSTGLRALWTIRQRLQDTGCTFILRSPSEPVQRVLRLTKLHKVFQVER
jgi:anti-sigma B factor antagonist